MNKKLKAKWIRALRNGTYRQAKGALANKRGTAFCCLGVLADIQGCRWLDNANEGDELLPVSPVSGRIIGDGTLSHRDFNGGLSDDQQRELASLNDNGNDFHVIAEHIERNL